MIVFLTHIFKQALYIYIDSGSSSTEPVMLHHHVSTGA